MHVNSFLQNCDLNITKEEIISSMTLETYLELAVKKFPAQFQLIGQEFISLDGYEAGATTVEFTLPSGSGKQILYTIKNGAMIWNVTFSTGVDEFEQRLPVFEQSIKTFKILIP